MHILCSFGLHAFVQLPINFFSTLLSLYRHLYFSKLRSPHFIFSSLLYTLHTRKVYLIYEFVCIYIQCTKAIFIHICDL